MIHSEFKDFVSRELGDLVNRNGATLYSSFRTVKEGKLYVLGLNPGGSDQMTIAKSLEDIGKEDYKNEYTIEWDRAAGQHPLQRNVAQIAELFNLQLEDICASNLIFVRSVGEREAGYEFRKKYWAIHQQILGIVKPKIIIAFGNGPRSPYQHLKEIAKRPTEEDHMESGHGKYKCVSFEGDIEELRLTVIGLPHLSRYHLYTTNPKKEAVRNWIMRKKKLAGL